MMLLGLRWTAGDAGPDPPVPTPGVGSTGPFREPMGEPMGALKRRSPVAHARRVCSERGDGRPALKARTSVPVRQPLVAQRRPDVAESEHDKPKLTQPVAD